jgi:hypothetical protein
VRFGFALATFFLLAACARDEHAQPVATTPTVAANETDGRAPPSSAPVDAAPPADTLADDAGPDDDDAGPNDFTLRFERTACLGTCPMYVVHVNADGVVRFASRLSDGEKFVDGCAKKNIGDDGVRAIKIVLASNGYFSLRNEYNGGPTDAPWAKMRVSERGKIKEVNHYLGAPVHGAEAKKLATIESALDRLTGAADFATQVGKLAPCVYTGK